MAMQAVAQSDAKRVRTCRFSMDIVKKLQRTAEERTNDELVYSQPLGKVHSVQRKLCLSWRSLGGGHREYELPLKLLTGNDRKSKPWSRPKRRSHAGKPIRRISSSKRGSERRGSNPERSRMLGLNRSSYALSSQCMAWSLSPMDA